ncbi:MAG: alpha/beta fold hydrolase [Bacteroidales bacterium]
MDLFFRKEGQGPALFILHGLFGMLDNWQSIARTLQEHHTVYLVDQRNHGRSPHSEVFTYEAMSNDLLELMNREELPAATILGHSMGGKTAMQFSINHPHRIHKLIVADISPRKYSNHDQHLALIDAMLEVGVEEARSRSEVREQLSQKIRPDHVRQFLLKNLYWKEKGKLGWRLNLMVLKQHMDEVFQAIEAPKPIDIPALFLKGEKSGYIRTADEHMIRNMFPQARISTIKNGTHWLHADNPGDFTREVIDFLKA